MVNTGSRSGVLEAGAPLFWTSERADMPFRLRASEEGGALTGASLESGAVMCTEERTLFVLSDDEVASSSAIRSERSEPLT